MSRPYIVSKAGVAVNPNEPGLVCGLNMKQRQAGTIFDVSGNGVDGTLEGNPRQGSDTIGNFLKFDSVEKSVLVDGFTLSAATPSIFSFFIDVKETGTDTRYIFDSNSGGSDRIILAWRTATTGQIGLFDGVWRDAGAGPVTDAKYNLVFYLNGVDTFYVFAKGEQIGTATYTPRAISTSATIRLMKHNSLASGELEGNLYNAQVIDATGKTLTQVGTWAADQYAIGKRALWKTTAGVDNTGTVTSGQIGKSPFRVDSGSFKLGDDTIEGKAVKAIECVTAGVCYVSTSLFRQTPKEAAHGEGALWIYKDNTANEIDLQFVGDSPVGTYVSPQSGYALSDNSDERIVLRKVVSGVASNLMYTAVDTTPVATWYKLSWKRTPDGAMSIYLNDVLLTASFGTNPITDTTYTESMYITLTMDAGDKIAYASQDGDIAITKRLLP